MSPSHLCDSCRLGMLLASVCYSGIRDILAYLQRETRGPCENCHSTVSPGNTTVVSQAEAVEGAGEGAHLHSSNQRYLKTATVEVNVLFQAVRVFTKLSETTLAKSQRRSGGEWKLLGVCVGGGRCCLSQTRCLHRSPGFHGMAYCQRERP